MYGQYNNQFYPGYGYQPQPQMQPIQQYPQSLCSFVKSIDELNNYRVMPNVYYIGVNRDNKEIYVRKMNNDGNIEVETYVLKSEEKQKSENELIAERLTNIEQLLKERNNVQSNGYVNQQFTQSQTGCDASIPTSTTNIQSNDGR